jgi:hypothetical protein
MYRQALGALAQYTSADIVVFTIPDVTAIPFVTTVKPYITLPDGTHVPLIGDKGPLPETAYVTLGASSLLAQGIGIPADVPGGTGIPLPEDMQIAGGKAIPGVVLRPEEVDVINQRIADFNQIIKDTAAAVGAKVFDINAIFARIAHEGHWGVGGLEINTDYLLGGIFGYDGVHPQRIGYGMVASELIDFLNEAYDLKVKGGMIPQVNMYDIMTGSPEDQPVPTVTVQDARRAFTAEAFDALQKVFHPLRLNVARTPRHPASRVTVVRPKVRSEAVPR